MQHIYLLLHRPHFRAQFKQQSKFLRDTYKLWEVAVKFLPGMWFGTAMYLVRYRHEETWNNSSLAMLSIRGVTNDCRGPVGNVWKCVAYLSILEFDISSIRSFLKREKITQCNAFSLCVATFFYDFIYRFQKLFDESVPECRAALGSPYIQDGWRKPRSYSFPLWTSSSRCMIHGLCASNEKWSNFRRFDTFHISYYRLSKPFPSNATSQTETTSATSFAACFSYGTDSARHLPHVGH